MSTPIALPAPSPHALLRATLGAALGAALTVGATARAQTPAAAPATPIAPADTAYTPSYQLPDGRQIVAVYLGSQSCGPCRKEETKLAIRRMKPLLAAQAKRAGAAFAATVVSIDWKLEEALTFSTAIGAFDEYVLGANWTNAGAQRYLWADSTAQPAIPQVVVVERTVRAGMQGMTFGPDRVLRRISGDAPIIEWVRAGAPIDR